MTDPKRIRVAFDVATDSQAAQLNAAVHTHLPGGGKQIQSILRSAGLQPRPHFSGLRFPTLDLPRVPIARAAS